MSFFIGLMMLVLWPVLTGLLFAIIVGGPIFLGMKLFEYLTVYILNPIIAILRDIPFIGKLICFIITLIIGLPLLISYILYIFIPVLCIIVHGVTYGAV